MKSTRILIVEDEFIIAQGLQLTLKKMGYAICGPVATGEAALQMAASEMPDLVLMDIMLKGAMNGIEAAKEIRIRHGAPVIFLTAFADNHRLAEAKQALPYGYILKPYRERELKIAIEMALFVNQAEKEKRRAEAYYRLITEHSLDMISKHDPLGVFTYASPASERLLGYTPRELVGRSAYDFFHPEDRERIRNNHPELLQAPFIHTLDCRFRHKAGHYIWIETQNHPIIDPHSDAIQEIVANTRDISARKEAQAKLRESEARWQFALEGAGDGVWDWDATVDRVFYSRQWKAMLGFAEDEIGDSLDEWKSRVHPDDLAAVQSDLERHFNGQEEVYINEHRMQCKDGTCKWILDRGMVVERTAEGRPKRVIGTHTDISERKAAEVERERMIQELNEALAKVKTLSGFLPICSICKRIRDDQGYWNQIENYIRDHTEAEFSHSICQECARKHYGAYLKNSD